MKKKVLIIAIILTVAVGVTVFLLWRRKKKRAEELSADVIDEPMPVAKADTSAPLNLSSTLTGLGSGVLQSIASTLSQSNGEGGSFSYDSKKREIIVDGDRYVIPENKVKTVQQNLIEGFQSLAANDSNAEKRMLYGALANAMIKADSTNMPKTGIDGKIGSATAQAFAKAAELMPSVVKVYKVN